MLIHRRGVGPKVAYQEMHGAMTARTELEQCQDVLAWLKGALSTVPVVYHHLPPLHLPEAVYLRFIGLSGTTPTGLTYAGQNEQWMLLSKKCYLNYDS